MCKDCKAPQYSCDECPENQGFDSWQGRKPCGQQNCWFGCTVCEYNRGIYKGEDNDD